MKTSFLLLCMLIITVNISAQKPSITDPITVGKQYSKNKPDAIAPEWIQMAELEIIEVQICIC